MSNERIEQLLTDANAAIDAGDIGRAVAGYQEVLASEPDNYEACLMLGSLLGEAGQLEQAAALLRSAAAVRTDDATASITLGHVLRAMGDGAGAIAALEEAVRREPRDYDAICTLGSMFAESEYRAEAVAQFRQAAEIDPQRAEAWSALGAMLILQDDAQAAVDTLQTARRIDPEDREIPLQLGMAYIQLERLDEAESILQEALSQHASYPDLQFWLAEAQKRHGRLADALLSNAAARSMAPDNDQYVIQAAAITEAQGDTDAAFALLQPVLQSDDVPVEAALLFALMSRILGRMNDARSLLDSVASKDITPEQRGKIDEVMLWLETV